MSALRFLCFGDFAVIGGLRGFHLRLGFFDGLLTLFVELCLLPIGFGLTLRVLRRFPGGGGLSGLLRFSLPLVGRSLALRLVLRLLPVEGRLSGELLALLLLLLLDARDRGLLVFRERAVRSGRSRRRFVP